MTKSSKIGRDAKTGKLVGSYEILGETNDGVRIIKPKGKPNHFTVTKLKKAIASASAAGHTKKAS